MFFVWFGVAVTGPEGTSHATHSTGLAHRTSYASIAVSSADTFRQLQLVRLSGLSSTVHTDVWF